MQWEPVGAKVASLFLGAWHNSQNVFLHFTKGHGSKQGFCQCVIVFKRKSTDSVLFLVILNFGVSAKASVMS